MAARLDLEARLRALRTPAGPAGPVISSSSPAPAPAFTPATAAASSIPPQALAALPVAPGAELAAWPEPPLAWPEPPTAQPRRSGALGEVLVIPRRASTGGSTAAAAAAAPGPSDSHGVSVTSLLGPAYSEAIRIAQYAIENERNRNAHTAIDAYIRAGQMLISIGRQQDAAHLQTMCGVMPSDDVGGEDGWLLTCCAPMCVLSGAQCQEEGAGAA